MTYNLEFNEIYGVSVAMATTIYQSSSLYRPFTFSRMQSFTAVRRIYNPFEATGATSWMLGAWVHGFDISNLPFEVFHRKECMQHHWKYRYNQGQPLLVWSRFCETIPPMSEGETIQEVLAIVWRLQWFSAPIMISRRGRGCLDLRCHAVNIIRSCSCNLL